MRCKYTLVERETGKIVYESKYFKCCVNFSFNKGMNLFTTHKICEWGVAVC